MKWVLVFLLYGTSFHFRPMGKLLTKEKTSIYVNAGVKIHHSPE
jgi:hypothetical protein